MQCTGEAYRPTCLVADAAGAITNGFMDFFFLHIWEKETAFMKYFENVVRGEEERLVPGLCEEYT